MKPIIATRDRNTGILPVRLADVLSAYPKQRSTTPLGALTESLCCDYPWVSAVKILDSITAQMLGCQYARHPERKCHSGSERGTSHIGTDYTTWFAPINNI
jgi:hypothetical protein